MIYRGRGGNGEPRSLSSLFQDGVSGWSTCRVEDKSILPRYNNKRKPRAKDSLGVISLPVVLVEMFLDRGIADVIDECHQSDSC